METLKYIQQKYQLDLSKPSPIEIPIGRFKDVPRLFAELGFKKGAEIGVYRGLYSKYLFKYIPGLYLTGVDLWEIYPGYQDYTPTDIVEAHQEATKIYEKYGNGELIHDWSRNAARFVPDESLDFVFLDANHAYEYVVEDLAIWSKKVRKGGIVYGHDFDDYSNHKKRWSEMNVINAVEGWTKSYKIQPWFVITKNQNKCWLYVKD